MFSCQALERNMFSDFCAVYPAQVFQPKTIHWCCHMALGLADRDLLKTTRAAKLSLCRCTKLFLAANDKQEYRGQHNQTCLNQELYSITFHYCKCCIFTYNCELSEDLRLIPTEESGTKELRSLASYIGVMRAIYQEIHKKTSQKAGITNYLLTSEPSLHVNPPSESKALKPIQ